MKTGFSKLTLACAALAILTTANTGVASDLRVDTQSNSIAVTAATGQDKIAEGAKNFIASMGDRGINFLGNQSMSVEAKKAEFRNLLNQSFDMNTIARFSLGTYWKSATPAQQKEYMKLFNEMIVKVYSKRFSDYKGQKFEVKSARKENDKDSIVTSYIVPADGPQVQVDWRVRNKGGAYRVVDIIVEGVSMSQTQRADFASVINRGGGNVDVLLNHLRQQ
jgi:phospholipid transport system substrate-binding protein